MPGSAIRAPSAARSRPRTTPGSPRAASSTTASTSPRCVRPPGRRCCRDATAISSASDRSASSPAGSPATAPRCHATAPRCRGSCATTATAPLRSASGTSHLTGNRVPPGRSTGGRTDGASTTSTGSSAVAPASGTRCWPRTRRSSELLPSTTTRRTRTTSPMRWPTDPSSGCTASAARTHTSRSSCTSRRDAATHRTTSAPSGPTSTRASSTRGGIDSGRRRSPDRRSWASSRRAPCSRRATTRSRRGTTCRTT